MTLAAPTAAPVCVTAREAARMVGVSLRAFCRLIGRDEALRRARVYLTPSMPRYLVRRLELWMRSRPDSAAPGGGA